MAGGEPSVESCPRPQAREGKSRGEALRFRLRLPDARQRSVRADAAAEVRDGVPEAGASDRPAAPRRVALRHPGEVPGGGCETSRRQAAPVVSLSDIPPAWQGAAPEARGRQPSFIQENRSREDPEMREGTRPSQKKGRGFLDPRPSFSGT